MSKQLTLFIFSFLSLQFTFANGVNEDMWQKANDFFTNSIYDSAAYYYHNIAEEKGSSEVYYNLGNTYYKLNDIGKSILYYERALKYNPTDKRILDNLYLANGRINNRIQGVPQIFFVRWWNNITRSTNSNIYALVAGLLFLIIIGYHILRRVEYIKFNFPIQASIAGIVLTLLFLTLSIVSGERMVNSNTAIVMKEGSSFMKQPKFGNSQSLIPAGTKVQVSKEQKSWMEVALPDGRIGWLQKMDVEKI